MALMPKINLRLTDEEHEALKMWAQESHRSIQREAVFRLFSERSLSERGAASHSEQGSTPSKMHPQDGGTERSARAAPAPRSESDLHFKPDFK